MSCKEVARVLFEKGGVESLTRLDMGGSSSKMGAEQPEALKGLGHIDPSALRPSSRAFVAKEFGLLYEAARG